MNMRNLHPRALQSLGGALWEGALALSPGTYHFNLLVDDTEWVVPGRRSSAVPALRCGRERLYGRAPPFDHAWVPRDRKSTRLNSSHGSISYAVFCLKK